MDRAELDRRVGEEHSRYWADAVQTARGHHVILVEGDDDASILKSFLGRRSRSWSVKVSVVVAGSRSNVIHRLETTFPDGFGVVDRDTWTEADVLEARRLLGDRLFTTEGWCVENSLLEPLSERHPQLLLDVLQPAQSNWLQAGALWWTLQRKREAFNRWQERLEWGDFYGRPNPRLDMASPETLRDSLSKRITAAERAAADLDLGELIRSYETRLAEVKGWSFRDQWLCGVHGKVAFSHMIVPFLDRTQEQLGARGWRQRAADLIPRPPAPLDTLLAMVLP